MTSELKIDLTSFGYADGGYMSKCSHCKETFLGAKRSWSCEPCAIKKILEPKITRAVPDVPELVRYERTVAYERQEHFGMVEHRYGDYVLYSQAAEIIAAKDVEIAGIKDCVKGLFDDRAYNRERAEAAEAKLAQYEAQEPVGYVTDRVKTRDGRHCFMSLNQAAPYINPVYASPLAPEGGKQ